VSATSGPSAGDLRGRAWRSIRFAMVGGGVAIALGVLLASFGPDGPREAGPIFIVLVMLPAAAAALIEWRYEVSAQAQDERSPKKATNGA
jgi:hypothetical protein